MLVLAFIAKRNTEILESDFPMDIYYAHGIINPTDNWAKEITKHTVQNFLHVFYSVFFSYLFWFPEHSE